MKTYSTLLIACFLLGLCIVEKDSKQRALEARQTYENLLNNIGMKSDVNERTFASLSN